MKPVNKIILNTTVLNARLLIGLVIGLFTTRLILSGLGETNYGIYALVAGVIGMLGILNASMSNASMRFMAHSLGTGNQEVIIKTFNSTLFLHFLIGLIVIAIMEIGGGLMFNYLLNIPVGNVSDAKIIFHLMVITSFITIISVPYDAVINAHENILLLSLVDLLGNIISLGIAVYISYSTGDLLIIYGFLTLLTQIILRIIKQWYSRTKYQECKINFRTYLDKDILKTILSYSGWNLFGSIAAISITQVKSIFLNMFFGVSVNAADGISTTVSGQVNMISISMTRALNPQLVKSEGKGDRQRMLRFTELSTKFSIFLFAICAIPVILETSYLLTIWLKIVPKYSVIFSQLILITIFIEKFTFEITTAIRAVGKIRFYTVSETLLLICNIPIIYFVLRLGYPPYFVFGVGIISSFLAAAVRLYFGTKIAGMNVKSFLRNGIRPILIPLLMATIFSLGLHLFIIEGFVRLFLIAITSFFVLTICFWFFGLEQEEIKVLKQLANLLVLKIGLLKNTSK